MNFPSLAATVACITLSANVGYAATFLVTDVYQMEAQEFVFEDNFWSRFPEATDANDTVPIDRISMTFEVSYFSPISQTLQFRNPVESFQITDLEFVTIDVPGLTVSETLTEADITRQSASISRFRGTSNRLRFDARFDNNPSARNNHQISVWVNDFSLLSQGDVVDTSIFRVDIESLQSFDSPDYLGLNQAWTVERVSSSRVLSAVPLPAGGGLLLAAMCLGGALSRRRRAYSSAR